MGFDALAVAVALSTFLFAGALSLGTAIGLAFFMLSTFVSAAVLMFVSQFKHSAPMGQDTAIAILAPGVVIAAAATDGTPEAMLATAMCAIGVTTFLSGSLMVLAGTSLVGRLLKMIPYSVSVGFLSGSGWLLVFAAITVALGSAGHGALLSGELGTYTWVVLGCAVILGLTLFVISKYSQNAMFVVGTLLASIAIFYALRALLGISVEEAREFGFLGSADLKPIDVSLIFGLYSHIDFNALTLAAVPIIAASFMNVLACTLNNSGLELVVKKEVKLNREVRNTGLINMAIGPFGGVTAFAAIGSSTICFKLGAGNRYFHVAYITVPIVGLFFAESIVSFTPIFASAGFIIYGGLILIDDWLLATRSQMPNAEWAVVAAVFLMTVVFGILPALAFGLCLALVLFIVNYAKTPIIRHQASGASFRSNVDRSPQAFEQLMHAGAQTKIIVLQGYLFFGSIEKLIELITESDGDFNYLILDFRNVPDMDAAAYSGLTKLEFLAAQRDLSLLFSGIHDTHRQRLARWGLQEPRGSLKIVTATLDQALEWCEDRTLDAGGVAHECTSRPFEQTVANAFPEIADYFKKRQVLAGETLIKRGDDDKDLYFLDDGHLSVWIEAADGTRVRVRRFAQGAFVGEMAMLLGDVRTADIVADVDSFVYVIDENSLDILHKKLPSAAAQLYRVLARNLAGSVKASNLMMQQLRS